MASQKKVATMIVDKTIRHLIADGYRSGNGTPIFTI